VPEVRKTEDISLSFVQDHRASVLTLEQKNAIILRVTVRTLIEVLAHVPTPATDVVLAQVLALLAQVLAKRFHVSGGFRRFHAWTLWISRQFERLDISTALMNIMEMDGTSVQAYTSVQHSTHMKGALPLHPEYQPPPTLTAHSSSACAPL
jgi:hypothetical protein